MEGSIGPRPGGYVATNVSLRLLIIRAYGLRSFQVVGGPGWIDGDRFDVVARTPENTPSDEVPAMLRTVLAERFKLAVHVETREQPIYALVIARPDRRLGPSLTPSTQDCSPPAPAPDRPGTRCVMSGSFTGSGGVLRGVGQPLAALATQLGTAVDRIVQDRTGMTGRFDFELTWSRGAPTDNLPSVFTAIQEQLGLRLEAARGPVDVLVVDSVERPTPD